MLVGLDEIPFPIPNILVAARLGVRVAGVVLELGGCYVWSIVVLGTHFIGIVQFIMAFWAELTP
jgi:hypothetical protein